MKVNNSGNDIVKYVKNEDVKRINDSRDETAAARQGASKSQDGAVVNLSEKSKDVQKAKEIIEAVPDVRTNKVAALKNEIERGTYKIDYKKTADKMLKAFSD